MTRLQPRLVVASVSACFLLMGALVAVRGQQPGAPDPERAFSFGDTDLDGKLSLDEFRELLRNGPRLKKNVPAKKAFPNLDAVFQRLDTNRDGSLTIPEYRQIVQLRPGGLG